MALRERLERFGSAGLIVVVALSIAWAVAATARAIGAMGLPLDESYGYLARTTDASALWPLLLAPFASIGAPVWGAFALCTLLSAAAAVGVYRFAYVVSGRSDHVGGLSAAVMALLVAEVAWLAGLEVALVAALTVACLVLLAREAHDRPSWLLVVTLAGTALSRFDATLMVGVIVLVRAVVTRRVRWLVPPVAPSVWLIANPGIATFRFAAPAWDLKSPHVWIMLVLFVVGALRVGLWARREKRLLVALVVIAAPFVLNVQALLFVPIGVALVPLGTNRRVWQAGALVVAIVFAVILRPRLVADIRRFAKDVYDMNRQHVAAGRYVRDNLPGAHVMAHQTGTIAYYSRAYVVELPIDGAGTQFEYLESLPVERRPTHFVVNPAALGTSDFFGKVLAYKGNLQVIEASWDHVGTAERPLNDHSGWAIVDRVDIADLASERAHQWSGMLGSVGEAAARSVVERSTKGGLYIDGGRTIRGRSERFTVRVDPTKPTRVVIRTGGQKTYPWHEAIAKPIDLALYTGAKKLGQLTVAPPTGPFSELTFNLPPYATKTGALELRTEATGMYRVFQWFILQSE